MNNIEHCSKIRNYVQPDRFCSGIRFSKSKNQNWSSNIAHCCYQLGWIWVWEIGFSCTQNQLNNGFEASLNKAFLHLLPNNFSCIWWFFNSGVIWKKSSNEENFLTKQPCSTSLQSIFSWFWVHKTPISHTQIHHYW